MNSNSNPYSCLRIVSMQSENARTKSVVFDRAIECEPGQFVMVWLPKVNEKPFSIVGDDPFVLTIVSVGSFSAATNALRPGDRMWIRGPLGKGFEIRGNHLLLAGGGYGAAPLYFLAKKALDKNKKVTVCLGAQKSEDILFEKRFRELGCKVLISSEDGSIGQKGLVTDLVNSQLITGKPDGIFGCGPVKLLEVLEIIGREWKLPSQLSWEGHMRCGIGLCGSCEAHRPIHNGLTSSWLTCMEGPVWFNEENEKPL